MSQVCDHIVTLREHRINIVGISTDDEKHAHRLKRRLGLCFDLLCDTHHKVMESYDVVDTQKRYGKSIALSADVVIDQHGEIIYFHKGHYTERPGPREILAAIGIAAFGFHQMEDGGNPLEK